MQFISVWDLSTKPKKIWSKIKEEEVVVTSNGKPIALLSGVTEETLEKTIRAIRRSRALIALEEMQKKSMELVLQRIFSVIPVKTGIQKKLKTLDSCFHRNDKLLFHFLDVNWT